jgi:hypothetical protein
MSAFVGAALPQFILYRDDRRLVGQQYQYDESPQDFRSAWWPAGQMFTGEAGVDYGVVIEADWYEMPEITRGISSRLGFVGVTRDAQGAPLGNCTVRVFRTSDGALVHETVSNANGAFMGCAYDGSTYFLVFYKTGVPDVFGTTVNTLIGS